MEKKFTMGIGSMVGLLLSILVFLIMGTSGFSFAGVEPSPFKDSAVAVPSVPGNSTVKLEQLKLKSFTPDTPFTANSAVSFSMEIENPNPSQIKNLGKAKVNYSTDPGSSTLLCEMSLPVLAPKSITKVTLPVKLGLAFQPAYVKFIIHLPPVLGSIGLAYECKFVKTDKGNYLAEGPVKRITFPVPNIIKTK